MTMKRAAKWGAVVGLVMALGPLGCAVEGAEDEAGLDELEAGFSGDPVIFVHGCTPPGFTDEESAHDFDDMVAYFAAHGYPADHLVLFQNMEEQCTSIKRYAWQLEQLIDDTLEATGKSKVDLVGHSLGAISSRYYLHEEGSGSVRDVVSLAGVHHGTTGGELFAQGIFFQDFFGGYPWFEGVHEVYPPYACDGEAYGHSGGHGFPTAEIQLEINGCLTPTGRTVNEDETPGNARYVAVRNTLDDIVLPVESACLNMSRQNDCSSSVNKAVTVEAGVHPGPCEFGCPAHLMVLFDANVIARTFNFVRGGSW